MDLSFGEVAFFVDTWVFALGFGALAYTMYLKHGRKG